jgi:hypothetical protein
MEARVPELAGKAIHQYLKKYILFQCTIDRTGIPSYLAERPQLAFVMRGSGVQVT